MIGKAGEEIIATEDRLNKFTNQIESLRAQQSFYENVISNYQGHLESTRMVMMNKTEFPGIHGPLSDLIEIPQALVSAVEVALGEAVNYLIVDKISTAEKILSHVETKKLGRVTLVPLDRVKALQIGREKILASNLLIDKLNFKNDHEQIIRLLLGDVIIVKTLQQAINESEKNQSFRYVTENGEIITGFQGISGGQKKDPETSLLGRKDLIAKIKKEISTLRQKSEKAKKESSLLRQKKEKDSMLRENCLKETTILEERMRELERQETEIQVQSKNNIHSMDKREHDKKEAITLLSRLRQEIAEDDKKLQTLLSIINIIAVTERTVTDKKLLLAQIMDVRKTGYSVSHSERIPGTICISVPVYTYSLPVALSVVGPDIRLQPRVREVIQELKASSIRISKNITDIFGPAKKPW
jgi:chromosome segregation protein